MVLTLYVASASAPCRQVLLTAQALNLKLDLKNLDLMAKEQLNPEFVKLNPQHMVPTLVDGEFVLWESRAITRYLVNKYGAGTKLYPQDPQARAIVDQRLDFDQGTLYQRFADYFYPQFTERTEPEESKLKKLEEALGFLNIFLEGNKYAAGSDLTIADLALVASVSTFNVIGVSLEPFPNIVRWYELVRTTAPGYQEANQKYLDTLNDFLAEVKAKIAAA